jgi:hypothetical protein
MKSTTPTQNTIRRNRSRGGIESADSSKQQTDSAATKDKDQDKSQTGTDPSAANTTAGQAERK